MVYATLPGASQNVFQCHYISGTTGSDMFCHVTKKAIRFLHVSPSEVKQDNLNRNFIGCSLMESNAILTSLRPHNMFQYLIYLHEIMKR